MKILIFLLFTVVTYAQVDSNLVREITSRNIARTQYTLVGNLFNAYAKQNPTITIVSKKPRSDLYKKGFVLVAFWNNPIMLENGELVQPAATFIYVKRPTFYGFMKWLK